MASTADRKLSRPARSIGFSVQSEHPPRRPRAPDDQEGGVIERSEDLRELIYAWFDAFSRGDGAWIKRHIAQDDDVRLIGTDPTNWEEGQDVGDFLSSAVDELGGTVRIVPGDDALALREGNIGWAVTRATVHLPDGREIGFRWSAVFRQDAGAWKAVQIHGSIGVPDEEAFGAAH